ncbi:MAG: Gar1/Naf1 family protein [Candidatus Nitrosocosmicus sp.]|nr:Gar1/Naf1 family protein [Candidatus Nitrosocosmicus sp.]
MTEEYVSNNDYRILTMELLGEILHFSKSGRLIVKVENRGSQVKSGLMVLDNREKRIGKIAELIGSVNSPYASIIPFVQAKNKMAGLKVYFTVLGKKDFFFKIQKKKEN